MVFRKKAHFILAYKPDILVVPECEHPSKLVLGEGVPAPCQSLWFGHNQHKGLGIFAWNDFRLRVLSNHNTSLKIIVPIRASRGSFSMLLFAVWANNPGDPDGQYVTQLWKALHFYKRLLKNKHIIMAGDFNSNTIWDRPRREGNHSAVVKLLAEKGIYSTYHHYFKQVQGKERHATLYLYRHKDKPYHIDYCFASAGILQHLQRVSIGRHTPWAKHSDHMPVIVTFKEGIYDKTIQ